MAALSGVDAKGGAPASSAGSDSALEANLATLGWTSKAETTQELT